MNFYDVLAAEKWSGGVPTINFFDLLFAQSIGGGEQWQTYEGTLPATINANGDDMRQYQIYGNTGGVGDRTINVYNSTETTWSANSTILDDDGRSSTAANSHYTTNFTAVEPETIYYLSGTFRVNGVSNRVYFYDDNKIWLSRTGLMVVDAPAGRKFTTPANCNFIQIQTGNELISTDDWCIIPDTTPPETFVPYGYKLDMAVGSNILQSSEIEQHGWQAAEGTVPLKITNPLRCCSKDIYQISGEKIFYDFKSLNVNIAFVNSNGVSLGGSGFKSGVGSTDIPANAVKCLFIIANTNTSAYITPDQVIAAKIWASVDATNTPIYIGDDPLEKDEYVDYQAGKVFRRTENFFDKDTVIPDKQYDNSGNLISPTEPGTWYASGLIEVEVGETYVRCVAGETVGNVVNFYKSDKTFLSRNKPGTGIPFVIPNTAKYITFAIKNDATPIENYMLINGSVAPLAYIPYLQPTDPPVPLPVLPTVEGTTIVDYAGSGAAPEKVYFEYKGGTQS